MHAPFSRALSRCSSSVARTLPHSCVHLGLGFLDSSSGWPVATAQQERQNMANEVKKRNMITHSSSCAG